MNLRRSIHLFLTSLPRAIHRRGFGIQSPWAYELIRDVLFEPLHYYAYKEQELNAPLERQIFRIRIHYKGHPIILIDEKGEAAAQHYEDAVQNITPDAVLIMEHINDENADLWTHIVNDPRAIITFDMRKRGMVIFDPQRIKQNYLL